MTTPPPAPGPGVIVATVVVPLIHVPPVIALLNVIVDPVHTPVKPEMAPGTAITVTVNTDAGAQPLEYVITALLDDEPPDTPDTTPPPAPGPGVIVATVIVPLVHVPPVIALLNVIVDPSHTRGSPVIAPGNAITVTVNTDAGAQPLE